MLPTFAIIAATLGMLLIVFLILRETGDHIGSSEKRMLLSSAVLVVAVGVWQAIAQMGAAAPH